MKDLHTFQLMVKLKASANFLDSCLTSPENVASLWDLSHYPTVLAESGRLEKLHPVKSRIFFPFLIFFLFSKLAPTARRLMHESSFRRRQFTFRCSDVHNCFAESENLLSLYTGKVNVLYYFFFFSSSKHISFLLSDHRVLMLTSE